MIMSLKQLWNKPETNFVLFQFYFSFISHVRASEIKLKQICFISVLFQFYFTCKSRLRISPWNGECHESSVNERSNRNCRELMTLRRSRHFYLIARGRVSQCGVATQTLFCRAFWRKQLHSLHCSFSKEHVKNNNFKDELQKKAEAAFKNLAHEVLQRVVDRPT